MGLNGYEPYPGEQYITPRSMPLPVSVHPYTLKEPRLKQMADKLINLVLPESQKGRKKIDPPSQKDYKGVIDIFFPNRSIGSHYLLAIDERHKRFEFWNSKIENIADNFTFNPTSDFEVKGKVEASGQFKDFKYYAVRILEVKHKK